MKLTPLGDRLIVERSRRKRRRSAASSFPTPRWRSRSGARFLAVGAASSDDTGERIPMDVAVGDQVVFSKYGGTEIRVDGADY